MKSPSLRTELLIALIVCLLSLLVLPALIYLVGAQLFGPYQSGLAGMYAANLQGLIKLQMAPWILTLVPACSVLLLRAVLRMTASSPEQPQSSTNPVRREPRLNL